ncbi:hypothetical protein FJZ39_04005 [Candidatus Saccharibacteria bacterium]|nr:hypothetical protein [Candidatus Saccharibacteria bacterium]
MRARDMKDLLSPNSRNKRAQSFTVWRDTHVPIIAIRVADRTKSLRRSINNVRTDGKFEVLFTYHHVPKGIKRSRFERDMLPPLKHEIIKRLSTAALPLKLDKTAITITKWEPEKYDPHTYDSVTFKFSYTVSH